MESHLGLAVPSPADLPPTQPSSTASGARRHRARGIVTVLTVLLVAAGIVVTLRATQSGGQPAAALGANPPLRIAGGALLTRHGRAVRLLGVDVTGTESACIAGRQVVGATFDDAEADTIRRWHIDAVRVPLNEDCWLGINGVTAQLSAAAYQALIERWVRALHAAGIVAILDLHWTAPDGYVADRQWPMADADHSITFWSEVAARFASFPGVVFDLFNEPTLGDPSPTAGDWACWLRGCETTAADATDGSTGSDDGTTVDHGTSSVTYRTAGMQQLVDAVRGAGAHQPILVAGLNYANDPCARWAGGMVGSTCAALPTLPADPEHQLGLSFHVYDWTSCRTASCWSSLDRLATAARIPIVTTEFGEDDCRDDFVRAYMHWADARRVSYLAWTWTVNQHPVCVPGFGGQGADLSLLQNWDGAPSTVSPEAAPLRAHLAAELR